MKPRHAFTLVELLVVVAVVGCSNRADEYRKALVIYDLEHKELERLESIKAELIADYHKMKALKIESNWQLQQWRSESAARMPPLEFTDEEQQVTNKRFEASQKDLDNTYKKNQNDLDRMFEKKEKEWHHKVDPILESLEKRIEKQRLVVQNYSEKLDSLR